MSLNFDLDELNNLDPADMGAWPLVAKIIVLILLSVLISVFSYYLLVDEKLPCCVIQKLKS